MAEEESNRWVMELNRLMDRNIQRYNQRIREARLLKDYELIKNIQRQEEAGLESIKQILQQEEQQTRLLLEQVIREERIIIEQLKSTS